MGSKDGLRNGAASAAERIAQLSPERRRLLTRLFQQKGASYNLHPLSYAQERMWFLYRSEVDNPFYNVRLKLPCQGRLDVTALRGTLTEIARRHETLRTVFPSVDGIPMQSIVDAGRVDLPVVDLSGLARSFAEAERDRQVWKEARRPFNLETGPVQRAVLLRVERDDHLLLLITHHIAIDGVSVGRLLLEFAALYEAFTADRLSPLPALPVQYADFARWQRRWLEGEVHRRQLDYWRRHLGFGPHILDLPADRPRPARQTYRGGQITRSMPEELTRRLDELGRQSGASRFMVLLAVFQALLYRYTGQSKICVGSPIANRNRPELEGLIGFFVNTLVFATDLARDLTFLRLLERVREVALEAYAHQDLPFDRLVQELLKERDPSRPPLVQVAFSLHSESMLRVSGDREVLKLPDLAVRFEMVGSDLVQFDLLLTVIENPSGLSVNCSYNQDLFDEERIDRLLEHYRRLLTGAASRPHQRILDPPLLGEGERRQLSCSWREARGNGRAGAPTALRWFAEHAAASPSAVAVRDAERSVSYGELMRLSQRHARRLHSLGVGAESRVGLCLEPSLERVIAVFSTLFSGGVCVGLDPTSPRLGHLAKQSGVTVLVISRKEDLRFDPLPELCTVALAVPDASPAAGAVLPAEFGEHHLAWAQETSEGWLALGHGGLSSRLLTLLEELRPTNTDTFCHRASSEREAWLPELLLPLVCGARLVVSTDRQEAPTALPPTRLGVCKRAGLYVLEAGLHPAPVGVDGSLRAVVDDGVRGYQGDPAATARLILPNPFSGLAGDRLAATGERGRRLADGTIHVSGNEGRCRWLAGLELDPVRVESQLLEEDSVEDGAVLVCRGDKGDELVAYVVPRGKWEPRRLHDHLAARLPAELVPRTFAEVERVPRTPDGRPDEVSLTQIPIFDTHVAERWEARLREIPGVREVAVLVSKAQPKLSKLHFSDALEDLPDCFFHKAWRRHSPRSISSRTPSECRLLFVDREGLGDTLAARLPKCRWIRVEVGRKFERLGRDRYALTPAVPEHYRQLMATLQEDGHLPFRHILHLWSYRREHVPPAHLDALEEILNLSARSLLFLIQALARVARGPRELALHAVSARAQPTGVPGEEVDYAAASFAGLLKTAALELSWLRCCHVDLAGEELASEAGQLERELRIRHSPPEIVYRDGLRFNSVLVKTKMTRQPSKIPLKKGEFYLLIGGLGGVGTALARFLIENYRARLLLMGRTVLPEREEWTAHLDSGSSLAEKLQNLLHLESLGGELHYVAADIGDLEGLRQAITSVERLWDRPLAGVFHLAGAGDRLDRHRKIADERRLVSETIERFETTLHPKVRGTWNLFRVLEGRPDAFVVAFSSIYAFFGGPTFGAYSAASSFLDACCLHHRLQGRSRVYCFGWSQWDEVGMSRGEVAAFREAGRRMGLYPLSSKQGVGSLLAGMAQGGGQLMIGLDGNNWYIQRRAEGVSPTSARLVAYLSAKEDPADISLAGLVVVDRYGRPAPCHFRWLELLPRDTSGAIDRATLLSLGIDEEIHKVRTTPRNRVESEVAEIWRQLLGCKQVGMEENFFSLGGHSLLATQLVARLHKTFKVEVSLSELFAAPTVAGLAETLVRKETKPGQMETIARLREQIRTMSPREAQALLAKKRSGQSIKKEVSA